MQDYIPQIETVLKILHGMYFADSDTSGDTSGDTTRGQTGGGGGRGGAGEAGSGVGSGSGGVGEGTGAGVKTVRNFTLKSAKEWQRERDRETVGATVAPSTATTTTTTTSMGARGRGGVSGDVDVTAANAARGEAGWEPGQGAERRTMESEMLTTDSATVIIPLVVNHSPLLFRHHIWEDPVRAIRYVPQSVSVYC